MVHDGSMAAGDESIRDDLLWIAEDFARIIRDAGTEELNAPSAGTRWTNRQLLFHMLLGQEIARTFLVLIGVFSRLPPDASRGWSRMLAALTAPYDWINWAGAVIGARILTLRRTERMMAGATRRIVRWYDHAGASDLARGMSVPPSWDPYFAPWMNRRDLLAWAPKHYRHHRAQLTLRSAGNEKTGQM